MKAHEISGQMKGQKGTLIEMDGNLTGNKNRRCHTEMPEVTCAL